MKHRERDWAAIAGLVIVLLGAAFGFYGEFVSLKLRMDESDKDRHSMMEQLKRLEDWALQWPPPPPRPVKP